MNKETSTKDKLSSLKLKLLNYYQNYSPVSDVSVRIADDKSWGIALDRQGQNTTARDEYCLINEVGRMFDEVKEATNKVSFEGVSDAKAAQKIINGYLNEQLYEVDEKALNASLDKFAKNENEARSEEQFASVLTNTLRRVALNYGKPMKYDVTGMKVMGDYFADVVKAKLAGKDVKDVAAPDSRLSLLNKIAGKSYNREVETFVAHIETLSPQHLKKLDSILEMGIPGVETCEGYAKKYYAKGREIRGKYNAKDIKMMRDDALMFLTNRMAEDALKGKYFDQTGDLAIFMDDKEQALVSKMSFEKMAEVYGMDLVKTHKGATLVGLKLAQAKENGDAELGKSLEILADMVKDSRSESEHPDVSVEVRQRLLDNVKMSYQKFGPDDDKFREVFNALIPNPCELAAINTYMRAGDDTPLHKKLFARCVGVKKLTAEATELATGKANIREAKKRLKSRQKAMREEMLNNTGFEANAALAEQAARGYMPTEKAVKNEKATIKEKRQVSLDRMMKKQKEKSK